MDEPQGGGQQAQGGQGDPQQGAAQQGGGTQQGSQQQPVAGPPGPPGKKGDKGDPGTCSEVECCDDVGPDIRTMFIVGLGLIAIVVVTIVLVYHYPVGRSKAVQAILGIALTAITTLTGTAFGIAAGAKSGSAAGKAAARDAHTNTARTKQAARSAAELLEAARKGHTQPMRVTAAAGQTIPHTQVDDLESTLIQIEANLRAAAG
jgi:hypothetical protein